MKTIDVCGLGNGLLDIFVEITEAEFEQLGFERATMRLVESVEQRELLGRFSDRSPVMASGGSVANSIIALAQLGGRAAFIGSFGEDEYGDFYRREFDGLGIRLNRSVSAPVDTGTAVALITPDGERTMRTHLGAAALLTPEHVSPELIGGATWLFLEGYLFANPLNGQPTIRRAIEVARAHGTKLAITCSESFVIETFNDAIESALEHADLVFANESEAMALAGVRTVEGAFERLAGRFPALVVTRGSEGAMVHYEGVVGRVPAFACKPRDLTGAGDMFAGAFLYGVNHGVPPLDAARGACYLAMHVVSRVGARLHHGARTLWNDCLEGRV